MNTYTISQVAEQLSLKVHTIRYWEKHVPMLYNVDRDERGARLYSRQDVYLLMRMKYYIEERRFTVKGAAEELINEMSDSTESSFSQRKEILEIMKRLEIQRKRLDTARDLLKQDIDEYYAFRDDEPQEIEFENVSLDEELPLDMEEPKGVSEENPMEELTAELMIQDEERVADGGLMQDEDELLFDEELPLDMEEPEGVSEENPMEELTAELMIQDEERVADGGLMQDEDELLFDEELPLGMEKPAGVSEENSMEELTTELMIQDEERVADGGLMRDEDELLFDEELPLDMEQEYDNEFEIEEDEKNEIELESETETETVNQQVWDRKDRRLPRELDMLGAEQKYNDVLKLAKEGTYWEQGRKT